MKTLVLGAGGQVGRALLASVPAGIDATGLSRAELDIADSDQVQRAFSEHRPDLLINAAAYTAVDKAESEPEAARRINADAPGLLADQARKAGAAFVQISTDFVFDGLVSSPYGVDAPVNPLGVYGVTKADGEAAVRAAMPDALIVRTAWVYAANTANFAETMLRLFAGGGPVRVVADQIGTPTHAASLARTIWALAAAKATGTYHVTDAGVASWYDFAVAIHDEALAAGQLSAPVTIIPIATADYPTPAKRPAYGVLDKSATWAKLGQVPRHWRHELALMIADRKGTHG